MIYYPGRRDESRREYRGERTYKEWSKSLLLNCGAQNYIWTFDRQNLNDFCQQEPEFFSRILCILLLLPLRESQWWIKSENLVPSIWHTSLNYQTLSSRTSCSWYIASCMLLLLLLSHFSRVWLCDPIDGSPPGSPIPGILQARTQEWVAISFSNALK